MRYFKLGIGPYTRYYRVDDSNRLYYLMYNSWMYSSRTDFEDFFSRAIELTEDEYILIKL